MLNVIKMDKFMYRRDYEAVKASIIRVKDPTAYTGIIETLAAFLLSRVNGKEKT